MGIGNLLRIGAVAFVARWLVMTFMRHPIIFTVVCIGLGLIGRMSETHTPPDPVLTQFAVYAHAQCAQAASSHFPIDLNKQPIGWKSEQTLESETNYCTCVAFSTTFQKDASLQAKILLRQVAIDYSTYYATNNDQCYPMRTMHATNWMQYARVDPRGDERVSPSFGKEPDPLNPLH